METSLPSTTPADAELAELWRQHGEAPFPDSVKRNEIDGIDLVYLDSATAGLVTSEVNHRGLDRQGVAMLHQCCAELDTVVPRITDPDARAYYERLRVIARLVAARYVPEPEPEAV
ncbi:hypothetical protein [Streptomyces rubellomurinus]|uniref:Uncharacterized protein n=1 Tax=Streptomyces sp. Y1 TaxID=3238634 RepID=A0AB39TDM3_9ACTN|nr:hypothetical protein [Streptomyces rubellomurinus]